MNAIDTFEAQDRAPFAFDGFASLIAPLGQQRFLDEYWERKPFVIRRGHGHGCAGYFDSLLSMAAVDALVGNAVLREADIRIANGHKKRLFAEFSRDGVADRRALLREHAAGATLVFDQIDRLHAPLDRALARCEVDLQLPCRANAFLTPPGQQGFHLHYDTHDVVILQLAGTKDWQICDSPLALPHEEQQYDHALSAIAKPLASLTLHPGDVLFMPRGFIHAASAGATTSLHVSIALRTRALREVAVSALGRAAQESPSLRKAALFRHGRSEQVHQARAELHRLVDRLDLGAAFDEVLKSFVLQRDRPRDGALLAHEAATEFAHAPAAEPASAIGQDTSLRLRPECLFHAFAEGGNLRLAIDGQSIALPAGVRPALELIGRGARFHARALPGLEEESRLLLVRKLHQAGMIALHD